MPIDLGLGRWIAYRTISHGLHQPRLLRAVGTLFRTFPILEANIEVVARDGALRRVFAREASFSNTSHAKNLIAGDFVIGMEAGPRHDREREFASATLPDPLTCGHAALVATQTHVEMIKRADLLRFDVIDDYMVWLAWAGMRGIFGAAAAGLESTAPSAGGPASALATYRAFFAEMRYLGAHLVIGGVAPRTVQKRARVAATALRDRVRINLPALRMAWGASDDGQIERNAVGLLWVGHPATVQAGALVMQELLARPRAYEDLRGQAEGLGGKVWEDDAFRGVVRAHVVEALRFRPPFPVLPRNVPRDTEYDLIGEKRAAAAAGSSISLLAAAGMFDPQMIGCPHAFQPLRPADQRGAGAHHLIFGNGPRSCIAQDHVVEILTSAIVGLMTLPRLSWADRWLGRMKFDGPIVTRMRLKAAPRPSSAT